MAAFNPSSPEKFTPLTFTRDGSVYFAFKRFDDPDFVQLNLTEMDKNFEISWATGCTALESVSILGDFIPESDFQQAEIVTKSSTGEPIVLQGEPEDVINALRDTDPSKIIGYSLESDQLGLFVRPSWAKTYHDIKTDEVMLRLRPSDKAVRTIIDSAVSLTGLPGFRASVDETLDEFSEHLPILGN